MLTLKKTPFVMTFPSVDWMVKEKPALPLRYTGTMRGLMEVLEALIKQDLASKGFDPDQFSLDKETITIQYNINEN